MKKILLIVLFITGVCFAQKYEGMEFYPNGKPKSIKTYKVSKGKIEIVKEVGWHKNGQKSYEGTFKDGKPNGLGTQWYDNGKKMAEGTFKDGKEDGKWTGWHENGQKKKEGTYKDGKEDGLVTGWFENGQKKSEVNSKDGTPEGLWTGWHENGQKREEGTYKDGKEISETKWEYYSNGQKKSEGTYKDGKRDGLWTWWYETGQKRQEGTYKDGKEDGLVTIWFENGQKSMERNYKDGKDHGSQKYYNKKDEVTYHVINIDDIVEIFIFGDFYRPQTYPKWESSIDESLKDLEDLFFDGFINEEDYILFKTDLLKDEKYWNEDGSVKE